MSQCHALWCTVQYVTSCWQLIPLPVILSDLFYQNLPVWTRKWVVMLAMMMTRMILILMMIIWYDIVSGNERDFSNDNIYIFCDNNDLTIHCHLTLEVLTCSTAGHAGSNDPAQPEPSCLNRWWRVHWGSLLNKDDFWLVVSFFLLFSSRKLGKIPMLTHIFVKGVETTN